MPTIKQLEKEYFAIDSTFNKWVKYGVNTLKLSLEESVKGAKEEIKVEKSILKQKIKDEKLKIKRKNSGIDDITKMLTNTRLDNMDTLINSIGKLSL
jgi:hypothetical protein